MSLRKTLSGLSSRPDSAEVFQHLLLLLMGPKDTKEEHELP